MPIPRDLEAFFAANSGRIRDELFAFLRIPSVSARSEHNADTARAADWVADALRAIGLRADVHRTKGHPVVVGEWRGADGAPTVLVYGHYDVQPPEPLELWDSPPFEPTIRDGKLFARGSVDDKGQLFLHVKALEAHLKVRGSLPVNILVLAEGEEEIGSPSLTPFVDRHADLLRSDAVVISDSSMFAPGLPSILSSLRGLAYFQIDVEGPTTDLHSGSYGGAVVNPATALARIIATLHDDRWRVAIPGFYDRVRDWSADDRAQVRALPFDEEVFRRETGAPALNGEAGFNTLERVWARPTCEVKIRVTHLHGGRPWRAQLGGPLYDAARRALAAAFGREPVVVGEGGSIPVVGDFDRVLAGPVLLMGFGLPGENAHAPNEWISVDNFERGMRAVAALWEEVGKTGL